MRETSSKTSLPGLPLQHSDVELQQIHHGWHEVLPEVPADILPAQQDVESGDVGQAALTGQPREDRLVELLPAVPHGG